ncbi:MAG: hypothetical protein E4G89_04360, partial [Methanothrix sp.]
MNRYLARLPATLVAARGTGRPGLQRCCQGGLDCQSSALARGRRPVGPEVQVELEPDKGLPGVGILWKEMSPLCNATIW